MKRICVFCETWSSGGIESFLTKLLSQMDRRELQIDLVAVQLQDSVFTKTIQQCGIRMIELSGRKARWWSNGRQFQELLRRNAYDVVHVNAFQGLQLVYLHLAKRCGVPTRIAHSHGSDLHASPLWMVKYGLHTMGKHLFGGAATTCWACSAKAGAFLFPKGQSVSVIPNGINTAQYRFSPTERDRVRTQLGLEGAYVVGSVGRLQPGKNQSFLLDVLAQMLPTRPESRLLLVGEGEKRQELEHRAAQMGLAQYVQFYGLSDQVEELLWAMDAFAFPSQSEGLGLVAIEAQAAGLPVVASEHIPEEANLTTLFQQLPLTAGPEAWAQALLNRSCGMREHAADVVSQAGFEMSQVAERICEEYTHPPN